MLEASGTKHARLAGLKSSRLSRTVRQLRSGWLAIVLVATSVGSSLAAIANLKLWVTVPVAVTAIASGLRLLFVEIVVPSRLKAASMATARLRGRSAGYDIDGTALHIGHRRWVTTAHLVGSFEGGLELLSEERTMTGRVIQWDSGNDLVVIVTDCDWPWRVPLAHSLPEPGANLEIVGWAAEWSLSSSVRLRLNAVFQGTTQDGHMVATGPLPPGGFSGGAAVDVNNGRVIGLVRARRRGDFDHLNELDLIPASALRSALPRGVSR